MITKSFCKLLLKEIGTDFILKIIPSVDYSCKKALGMTELAVSFFETQRKLYVRLDKMMNLCNHKIICHE